MMAGTTHPLVVGIILAVGITLSATATATADTPQQVANTSTSDKDLTSTVGPPTTPSTSFNTTSTETALPKGRAVIHLPLPPANSSLLSHGDNSSSSSMLNSPPPFPGGLDDVSMDNDDETSVSGGGGGCVAANGARYANGQRWDVGCQERCTCVSGRPACTSRCEAPLRTRTEASLVVAADPMCSIKPTDDCCALLQCAQHEERTDATATTTPQTRGVLTTATSSCTFENKTHALGVSFNSGCDTCVCGNDGRVTCKPRCPVPQMPDTHQLCFKVPDRQDPCCTLVVCDVEEVERTGGMYDPSTMLYGETTSVPQADARALNATAAAISLPGGVPLPANASVETSPDGHLWSHLDAPNGVVAGLRPGRTYFIRLLVDDVPSPAVEVTLPEESDVPSNSTSGNATSVVQGDHCIYKGEKHPIGTQFHDGCMALCECLSTGVDCAPIDCPTNFGLDILDPNCVDWETLPRDFKPSPPHCCPDKVVCRSNGTCIYANESYPNYSDIPIEVTGCEQRCYCDNGNVTCSPMCPTVSAHPPVLAECPVEQPILALPLGDDCCRTWMCPSPNINQSEGHNPPFPLPSTTPSSTTSTSTATPSRPVTSTTGAPVYLGPYAPTSGSQKGFSKGSPKGSPKGATSKTTVVPTTPTPATVPIVKILPPTTPLLPPTPTAPTLDDNSPATTISSPNKVAISFAPTADPTRPTSDHPKPHKPHSYYIGPFVIDHDDEKDPSDPDFIPGPFNPNLSKPQNESSKPASIAVPKPFPPTPPTPAEKHETRPPIHPDGPQFVYSPNQQDPIPVYISHQHEQPQYHPDVHPPYPAHPEYQLVHINNQGYPEAYPKQPPQAVPSPSKGTANRPPLSNEELYRLQSGLQPGQQSNPDSNHEVYYVHGVPKSPPSNPQDVYHIVPHSPNVPIEEIIAHIRQQEQQSEQQQKPLLMQPDDYLQGHVHKQGRPNPSAVPAPIRPPILPPYSVPVPVPGSHPANLPGPFGQGHGHGHGLGDEDDLSTETSRHPAPHQQLAQLLSNQSYTGLPPMDQRPPFLPQGFPSGGFPSNHHDEIEVLRTEPSDTAVRLAFAVPRVLVGLHGRVEVRYTSDIGNNDENTWERQILAPPGDLISTPELEFELSNLHPDTTYNIRISVTLRNLHNSPSSSVITVRTHPRAEPPTTLPPQIPIDPDLAVIQVNSTWARLTWRKASPFELQFIDGVQLRYKEIDGKVYAATPLIHRAVTSYTLDGLRPDTKYVAGIVFVPFADQTTELQSPQTVTFTTGIENDPYKFDLNLEVSHIKSTSVELNWTGVPYPEDKFVNIFRAIYQSEAGKEDFSSFKVAKRDSPPRTLIQDLKPGTRYRLWLEAYLTNGRIKKSNVQDFMTKAGSGPSTGASTQDKLEGASAASETSDYYGALVAVTILAILGGIVSLTLLLILFKRCNQNKAAISTCRKSQSAYDNPSYKTCESELASNGHSNKTQRQGPMHDDAHAQD